MTTQLEQMISRCNKKMNYRKKDVSRIKRAMTHFGADTLLLLIHNPEDPLVEWEKARGALKRGVIRKLQSLDLNLYSTLTPPL